MHLVVANEEQKRARDALTFGAWGARLGREAFARREARLRAHPFASGGMTTWLWVDEDGRILASCETFRMKSFAAGVAGETYGIASVFTEERLRGRGHALAMMRALAARLRTIPGAQAAILFSEVGATLYRRAGFQARACHDRILPASGDASREAAFFPEAEAAARIERFARPGDAFVVWPDAAQIDWHLERARFYAEALGRPLPPGGAEVEGGRALFAADYRNERLAVLLAEAGDAEAAARLAGAAQHAAALAGLAEVRFWETPALQLPDDLGRRVSRDDDALPMILPLAAGIDALGWREIPRALWV